MLWCCISYDINALYSNKMNLPGQTLLFSCQSVHICVCGPWKVNVINYRSLTQGRSRLHFCWMTHFTWVHNRDWGYEHKEKILKAHTSTHFVVQRFFFSYFLHSFILMAVMKAARTFLCTETTQVDYDRPEVSSPTKKTVSLFLVLFTPFLTFPLAVCRNSLPRPLSISVSWHLNCRMDFFSHAAKATY